MLEYIVLSLVVGMLFAGSFAFGAYLGNAIARQMMAPKLFKAPVATERSNAIRETQDEDKYLKSFMDSYDKGLFMTADDYKRGQKNE